MPDEQNVTEPAINITETPHTFAGGQVEPVPGAPLTRFYANHAFANISMFEVRLVLSYVSGATERGTLVGHESMMITMAPEFAELVHVLLGKAIENYRRDYGELRRPKQLQQSKSPQAEPPGA